MDRTLPPQRHVSLLDSAARTTAASPHNGDAVEMKGRRGAIVFVDVTLDPDTVSIAVQLQGYDETAEAWYDIPGAVTGAIAAVGHTALHVYPGIGETANVSVSDVLPPQIRAVSTHTGGTTLTYSVQAYLLA